MTDQEKEMRQTLALTRPGFGNKNYSVRAGAGAGKTTMLSQRICQQILNGDSIDSFAIITYTNAAAAELRGKIADKLQQILDAGTRDKTQLDRADKALHAMELLQIATIHAFLFRILREYAFASGITVDARMLEDGDDEQRKEAFFNEWYRDHKHYQEINSFQDIWTVTAKTSGRTTNYTREVFLNMFKDIANVREEVQYDHSDFDTDFDALSGTYNTEWMKVLINFKTTLEADTNRPKKLLTGTDKILSAIKSLEAKDPSGAASEIADARKIGQILQNMKKQMDTDSGFYGKGKYDSALRAVCKPMSTCDERDWNFDKRYTMYKQSLTVDYVVRMQKAYQQKIDADTRHLSNDDILWRAYKLLSAPEHQDILDAIRSKYKRIYVDEFQDTTRLQTKIIKLIASPVGTLATDTTRLAENRLLIVGDPQQSIYRFTGAEKAAYEETDQFFKDLSGSNPALAESVTLKNNFRSNHDIVDWVNKCFTTRMGANYSPMETDWDFQTQTQVSNQLQNQPQSQTQVSNQLQNQSQSGTQEETLHGVFRYGIPDDLAYGKILDVQAVVSIVKDLVGDDRCKLETIKRDHDGHIIERPNRKIQYSDIMIICKNTTNMTAYADRLSEEGIPVNVNGKISIADDEVLKNFILLIHALADQRNQLDRIAANQVIQKNDVTVNLPFVKPESKAAEDATASGENEESVDAGKDSESSENTTAAENVAETKSTDATEDNSIEEKTDAEEKGSDEQDNDEKDSDKQTDVNIGALAKKFREAHMSCAAIVQYILNHEELFLPGGQDFSINDIRSYRTRLYQMTERCLTRNAGDLETLADMLSASLNAKVDREISLESNENAVRLMNVHKAKGLTGQIVIIADRSFNEAVQYSAYRKDDKYYPAFSYSNGYSTIRIPAYGYDKKLLSTAAEEETEEAIRLEYVAATRAAQALIIMPKCAVKATPWFSDPAYHYDSLPDITDWITSHKKQDVQAESASTQSVSSQPVASSHSASSPSAAVQSVSTQPVLNVTHLVETRADLSASRANADVSLLSGMQMYSVTPSDHKSGVTTGYGTSDKDNEDYQKEDRPGGNVFGTVMHRVFELIVRSYDALAALDPETREKKIGKFINLAILENRADFKKSDAPKKFYDYLLPLMTRYFGDVLGPILQNAEAAYPEYDFSFFVPDEDRDAFIKKFADNLKIGEELQENTTAKPWVNGQADLVVLYKDGSIGIYDYKSDARNGKPLQDFEKSLQEHYASQLELYKYAIGKAFNVDESNIRTELIHLYKLNIMKDSEVVDTRKKDDVSTGTISLRIDGLSFQDMQICDIEKTLKGDESNNKGEQVVAKLASKILDELQKLQKLKPEIYKSGDNNYVIGDKQICIRLSNNGTSFGSISKDNNGNPFEQIIIIMLLKKENDKYLVKVDADGIKKYNGGSISYSQGEWNDLSSSLDNNVYVKTIMDIFKGEGLINE